MVAVHRAESYGSGVELGLVLKYYCLFCCVIALLGQAWGWRQRAQ